jgi:hypothetical protein
MEPYEIRSDGMNEFAVHQNPRPKRIEKAGFDLFRQLVGTGRRQRLLSLRILNFGIASLLVYKKSLSRLGRGMICIGVWLP